MHDILNRLSECPIIAAVHDGAFDEALKSPVEIIFLLNANILTITDMISKAHSLNKKLFVHVDLAEGIGKDKAGVEYLLKCGADGIISTRSNIIKAAKEKGIFTVQRVFALDSQGVQSIDGILENSRPDMIEIMPGVVCKVIARLYKKGYSVIAGGLIETKSDMTDALKAGALAISTGKRELWSL